MEVLRGAHMSATRGAMPDHWPKLPEEVGGPATPPARERTARVCTLLCCLLLLPMVGCRRAPPAAEAAPSGTQGKSVSKAGGVQLEPQEIEKAGIVTVAAAAARHAPESTGFAVVITHEAIAQALAEVSNAAAAARQSGAALARGRSLAGTTGAMPIESLQAAERQATVDQTAQLLAQRRLSATYGQDAPWRDNFTSPELSALSSGEIKLARVTFPLGALGSAQPSQLKFSHLGSDQAGSSFASVAVWSAPADASIPGKSFFAMLKGSDAVEGERLIARAAVGAAESGVIVPFSAAIVRGGKYWCYIERQPGVFARAEIDISAPTDAGYFVTSIAPGAKIVTVSAGELLAHELNPGTEAE